MPESTPSQQPHPEHPPMVLDIQPPKIEYAPGYTPPVGKELDPEAVKALMLEAGHMPDDIAGMTIVGHEKSFHKRGGYNPQSRTLHVTNGSPKRIVKALLHEGQHDRDNVNEKLGTTKDVTRARVAAAITGLSAGLLGASLLPMNIEALSDPTPGGKAVAIGSMLLQASGVAAVAGGTDRAAPAERRAHKAARSRSLVREYKQKIFRSPQH